MTITAKALLIGLHLAYPTDDAPARIEAEVMNTVPAMAMEACEDLAVSLRAGVAHYSGAADQAAGSATSGYPRFTGQWVCVPEARVEAFVTGRKWEAVDQQATQAAQAVTAD